MNKLNAFLLIVLMCTVSGCGLHVESERCDSPIAANSSGESGLVESADAKPIVPDEEPKLSVIEELSLEQAFAVAEQYHLGLRVIASQIDEATGEIMQAGAFPNPEIIARTESAPFSGSTADEAEYIAGIGQNIPLGKRLSAARKVEEQKRKKLSVEMQARRLEIRKEIQSAFAEALFREKTVAVYERFRQEAANALAIAQARFEAGDAVATEVGQARIEVQRIELELEKTKAQRRIATERLLLTMGNPQVRIESLGEMPEGLMRGIPNLNELVATLDKHPLITAAQVQRDVEKSRYNLVEEQRKADLGVELSYRKLIDDRDAFDVGIRIPLPLFDRKAGRRRQVRAAIRTAQLRSEQVRRDGEYSLRQYHSALIRSINAATLLQDEIVPQSQKLLEDMETRYRAGDISMAELLPVRRDAIATTLNYFEALRDTMNA